MSAFLAIGAHLLADFHAVTKGPVSDPAALDALLRESALAAGAHILYSHCHSFGEGQGVTGVVLLAESHISIHTWPEVGFVAVDIFMCGDAAPQRALEVLRLAFGPGSVDEQTVGRGRA